MPTHLPSLASCVPLARLLHGTTAAGGDTLTRVCLHSLPGRARYFICSIRVSSRTVCVEIHTTSPHGSQSSVCTSRQLLVSQDLLPLQLHVTLGSTEAILPHQHHYTDTPTPIRWVPATRGLSDRRTSCSVVADTVTSHHKVCIGERLLKHAAAGSSAGSALLPSHTREVTFRGAATLHPTTRC